MARLDRIIGKGTRPELDPRLRIAASALARLPRPDKLQGSQGSRADGASPVQCRKSCLWLQLLQVRAYALRKVGRRLSRLVRNETLPTLEQQWRATAERRRQGLDLELPAVQDDASRCRARTCRLSMPCPPALAL